MARQTRQADKEPPKVHCADCRHATRDTEGSSFSIVTLEYYMGMCEQGNADGRVFRTEDGRVLGRVFMGKPRVCAKFVAR